MERLNRQKILVADDSEINRSILSDILSGEFEILEAENGRQALETIEKLGRELALVLLDIIMPVMDGFQVLEGMRDGGWLDDIPVIIMFAENNPDYVRRAYDLGVAECIRRPFDARILRRRVANTIMLYAKRNRLTEIASEYMHSRGESGSSEEKKLWDEERGAFHPKLLEWLAKGGEEAGRDASDAEDGEYRSAVSEMSHEVPPEQDLTASDRTLRLLEWERNKYRFFASMSGEVQFEYNVDTDVLTLSEWGAHYLGIREIQDHPRDNAPLKQIIGEKALKELISKLHRSTRECPMVECSCCVNVKGKQRWGKVIFVTLWSEDEPAEYLGVIGKFVDIHEEHSRIQALEQIASHDGLTGLLNRDAVSSQIEVLLAENRDRKYVLAVVDLDHFKEANDRYGHLFGDQVLTYVADKLRKSIRSTDLAARVGGDEFLVFMEYTDQIQAQAERIFRALSGEFQGLPLSVSMGLARSEKADGGYDMLFRRADQALYAAKRRGRSRYCFYDDSMRDMLSVLSPIESDRMPDQLPPEID